MANNEASFKKEFKEDLEREYPNSNIWTSTDLLRSGLPDFYVLDCGLFVAVEAKFITKLPKKKTSLVLSHTVTGAQQQFLINTKRAGSPGIVVIGSPQVAIVFETIKENYTLEECLQARRIEKVGGHWQVKGFLDGWRK